MRHPNIFLVKHEILKVGVEVQRGGTAGNAHDFMRFLFYCWSFAEFADICFVWFYELLETRDLLILPAGFKQFHIFRDVFRR